MATKEKEKPTVTQLTVSYPKETYFPIKFNGFDVGGLSMTVTVPAGMPLQEVHDMCWKTLKSLTEREFKDKLETYKRRLRETGDAVRE